MFLACFVREGEDGRRKQRRRKKLEREREGGGGAGKEYRFCSVWKWSGEGIKGENRDGVASGVGSLEGE